MEMQEPFLLPTSDLLPGSIFAPQDCHTCGHLSLILPKICHISSATWIFCVKYRKSGSPEMLSLNHQPPAVSHEEHCLKIILKRPHSLEIFSLHCISCQIYLAVKSIAVREFYLSTKRTTRTIKFLLVLLEK